jgi:hypothetical protein
VTFSVERRARGKRGLFRRAPDPRELGDRLGRIARRMLKDDVGRAGWKKERYVVELALHEAARVTLSVGDDADVVLRTETSFVGPALHAHAIARVEPLWPELDVTWAEPFDLDATRRATCEWFAGELRAGERMIGVEHEFHVDAPVLTTLGPRDAKWRDAVLADPLHARDAFAWWEAEPGREPYSSALLAMWNDLPWREPLDDDEIALMKRVDRQLRAAHRADIELELPWPEWAQIHEFLHVDDGYMQEVRRRTAACGRQPSIGYRRYDLDVELSGGWVMRLPAAFVGRWEDDGERYWATDGQRVVEFTSITANDAAADSDKLLAVAPERHAVIERISDGERRGRAEAQDVDGVHVIHGLLATAPHVAILTCKGQTSDEAWALATWRSLRNVGSEDA